MINKLNELKYAEEMIEKGFLSGEYLREITILGKYYRHIKYKYKDVEIALVEFCDTNLINFNEVKYAEFIKKAINGVRKYKLLIIDKIGVTQGEMDVIEGLPEDNLKKFALMCLVLGKIQYIKNESNYVNTPRSRLMRLANVYSSKKNNRHDIVRKLTDLELIRFCDNQAIEVKFMDYKDDSVFYVYDFDNIGNYYMMWSGKGKFIECEECRRLVKRTANAKKYCEKCSKEINIKKTINNRNKENLFENENSEND